MRSLRAALFEREDFAVGTSSRSSKLIHGGLRYLETFDWGLVFEASRERKILLKTASPWVQPLPFLVPVYRGHRWGLPAVAAGVWLYDLLSAFRNVGHPSIYSRGKTRQLEPELRREGLIGSVLYYDAAVHDTALTLANVRSGWDQGGLACNHAEVTRFLEENERVTGVVVRDRLSGKSFDIRARWVVNATGPWSDLTRAKLNPSLKKRLRLTKGVHIILAPRRLSRRRAMLLLAPSDGRVTFVIPWCGSTLVGTTETDFEGDPATVCPGRTDVDYLLDTANYYFPNEKLLRADIVSVFAGLRPLLQDEHNLPSKVSREHHLFSDRPGLLTIAGGKYTTYRRMAEETVDWLAAHTPEWRSRLNPCRTAEDSIRPTSPASALDLFVSPPPDEFRSIALHAIEREMAATVSDVLGRRLSLLLLDRQHGSGAVENVAQILRERLGWTSDEAARQVREYRELIRLARSGLD